jgi:glycosyltransferase involved in cell wall biosynthesis
MVCVVRRCGRAARGWDRPRDGEVLLMRIAIVSTPFIRVPPSGYGGTELFCYELSEELTARGHDVTVFTTGDGDVSSKKRSLYHRPVWPPDPADEVNHVAWALGEIARGDFDVVHLNNSIGVPLAASARVPIVHTLHHKRMDSYSRIFAAHQEPFYVAISQRQLELEVPLAHSRVIHHGLSPSRYPPSLREQGYLLHLGRYCEEKGTHLAIEVARLAGLPIELAGRTHPQDREYFETEVVPRLALPRVRDHGEADHALKISLLGAARALVLPLQWEEPFGLIAVEAMLSGTPVLGFAAGSFPEIIEDGVTGFLAVPGDVDALARFARGLERFDRARCVRRARERFSTATMTTAYEAVYRRAITANGIFRARVA